MSIVSSLYEHSQARSGNGSASRLIALRHAIRGIEGRHVEADAAASLLPLGIAGIDQALGGGLARAALHEIAAAGEAEIAAASAFALAIAVRGAQARAVLWIAEDMALAESGAPYGPGLDEIGLAPEQVVTVAVARARDVLWAMEEALRCRGVGAVVGELRTHNIDAVAGRRLALATTQQRTCALLLRAKPDPRPLAAATRWIVSAARAPSSPAFERGPQGAGPPAIGLELVRNRHGRTGSWILEWNRDEQRFDLAPAHPEPVAPAAADRPHRPAVA
jgi:protein ImuA